MPKQALVSIIIPTYNRAHLLGETLDAVLAQTYTHWECIVVDDGSTDTTKVLLDAYCAKDHRVKYYQRPNNHQSGGNGARNFGFVKSTGTYLIFLDSDDVLMPFALEQRITSIDSRSLDMLVVESAVFTKVIGDTNKVWNTIGSTRSNEEFLIRFFNIDMPWQTAGVMWNRQFFIKCGQWNETLRAWQDWELHCKALLYNPNLAVGSKQLDNYYRHLTEDGIANSYKSKSYLKAMEKALLSVYEVLKENKGDDAHLMTYYKKLIFNMLIKRPLSFNYNGFPLRHIFKPSYFKDISRFQFLKIYAVELLGKSTKIRKYILGKIYKKQQLYLQMQSSHLK